MKTILLGDCRTGSYLISLTLNQHPDVCCSQEVFSPYNDRQVPPFTQQSFAELFDEFDVVMVQRYQAIERPWLLGRVADQIISLSRQLLPQYRSWRTAMETGHWRQDHPLPDAPESIRIQFNQDDFNRWCRETNRLRRQMQYPKLPTLPVRYEDLHDQFSQTMQSIMTFLELDPIELPPAINPTPKFPIDYVGWPV